MTTTMRAVVKYPATATRSQKVRELSEGLVFVAMELAELDVPMDQIEMWLDNAAMAAQDEAGTLDDGARQE